MVAFMARAKESGRPALLLILGDDDVARLYDDPTPIAVAAERYVPEWPSTWCFIAGGTPDREYIERYCEIEGIDNAVMIGLDEAGLAQLKAGDLVPFDITLFGAPHGWQGDIVLGYAATAHDALERFAKHLGPDTEIRRSEGDL